MNSLSILLVDDSKVVRMVVAKQLEVLGFLIDTAEDGLQAVTAAKEKVYDLIFMDVMMPNLDGLEATKQIREIEQEQGREPTAIIGVTGFTNRAECIAAGMDDFLFKPVTIEQLKGAIKYWYPDLALPPTPSPSNMFADSDAPIEASELAEQRLADLKRRLGFS